MKKTHIVSLAIVGLMMVGVLAFVTTNVQAVTGTISSTVTIECPVGVISNGGALAFGYLAAPSNGFCDAWTISTTVGAPLAHSGLGDGTDFILTDHSRGDFVVTGSELITYSVAVTTPFVDPFLALSALTLDPLSPADPSPFSTLCLPLTVFVGGTLTVCPGAASGLHTATITITASY